RGSIDGDRLPAAYEAMDQTARAQDALLSQLVDLARSGGGGLRVDRQPVDVCAVIESLVDTLVPLSARHEVTVKCELERPVRFAMADELRLRQIFSNLLLNAIKF